MNPEEVQFLAVLYLIYLSDCLLLTRSSAFVLYARIRGVGWKVKSTFKAPVLGNRFWLMRPWLIPMGSSYLLSLPCCAFGKKGVCSISPIAQPAISADHHSVQFVFYEHIESVEVKAGGLFVNGQLWQKGLEQELMHVANTIKEVVVSQDRLAAVRQQVSDSFARGRSAPEQIRCAEKGTFLLNLACSVYAFWLLIFTPFLLFHFSDSAVWIFLIPLITLHVTCGLLFLRVHRKALPQAVYARWESFAKMMCCPPMMLRACDAVLSQVRIEGDPLAIIIACCKEADWRPEIQRLWRWVSHWKPSDAAPEVAQALAEYAAIYREELRSLLSEKKIMAASLEVDSDAIPAGLSCCPRCGAFYNDTILECVECNKLPVLKSNKGKTSCLLNS